MALAFDSKLEMHECAILTWLINSKIDIRGTIPASDNRDLGRRFQD